MTAYTDFASVYDVFMDDIPYDEWADYLKNLLEEYQCSEGLLLELGCGTGTMTQLLAQSGYDMIGLDNSIEMLQIAKHKMEKLSVSQIESEKLPKEKLKKEDKQREILYLLQDMREFELYGTVKAVISICDSINYMLENDDLRKVFSLVNNYLDPKGIFIFDFNTIYKYRDVIGDSVIAENRKDCSFIWENYYEEEDHINEYELSIFVKEEKSLYRKFSETHYQRGYELEEIKLFMQESGLQFITAYDAFTRNEPHKRSERIYVIAQERGK